eukprot:1141573-Pelagomonas_calceolata.AAC.1
MQVKLPIRSNSVHERFHACTHARTHTWGKPLVRSLHVTSAHSLGEARTPDRQWSNALLCPLCTSNTSLAASVAATHNTHTHLPVARSSSALVMSRSRFSLACASSSAASSGDTEAGSRSEPAEEQGARTKCKIGIVVFQARAQQMIIKEGHRSGFMPAACAASSS